MSTKWSQPNHSQQITPKSSLTSSPQDNKFYFTYPKQKNNKNGYANTDTNSPETNKTNLKIPNNASYHTVPKLPLSPSLSSNNSTSSLIANEYEEDDIYNNRSTKWYYKLSNWIKITIIILLIAIIITVAIYNDKAMQYSKDFLDWMRNHPVQGSFAYIGIYIICSVFMVPGSLLTLGAGFVYVKMLGEIMGVILASFVVWIGATIGATMAFINGRYLLRNVVEIYALRHAKFALIDGVVGMNGFKVTFLLRLSPITPYNVFNYFMGLTSVSLKSYFLASIGMLPDSIVYCFIGGSIASIAKLSSVGFTSDPVLLIVTIVGTIFAVIGVIYISYIAKKEFNKMASRSRSRMMINNSDVGVDTHNNHNNQNDIESNITPCNSSCSSLRLLTKNESQRINNGKNGKILKEKVKIKKINVKSCNASNDHIVV